jgi:hypothetical protein
LTPQEAIEALKASTEVTVGPELIAAALRMSPSVLRKHVRDGEYNISAYDIQGSRIRFFRKDFLQKIGELPMDPPERTTAQALDDLREELHEIRLILMAQLSIGPLMRLDELKQKEKTAGAATPTE